MPPSVTLTDTVASTKKKKKRMWLVIACVLGTAFSATDFTISNAAVEYLRIEQATKKLTLIGDLVTSESISATGQGSFGSVSTRSIQATGTISAAQVVTATLSGVSGAAVSVSANMICTGSLTSTAFVDKDDSAFFVDPSANSNLGSITTSVITGTGSPSTISINGNVAGTGTVIAKSFVDKDDSKFFVDPASGSNLAGTLTVTQISAGAITSTSVNAGTGTIQTTGGVTAGTLYASSTGATAVTTPGDVQCNNIRAYKWVDRSTGGLVVDPSGSSTFNDVTTTSLSTASLTVNGQVMTGCPTGYTKESNSRLCISSVKPANCGNTALVGCIQDGARLCSLEELHYCDHVNFDIASTTSCGYYTDTIASELWTSTPAQSQPFNTFMTYVTSIPSANSWSYGFAKVGTGCVTHEYFCCLTIWP